MNLEDGDDVFNWPWIYAVQVGEWGFNASPGESAARYSLRGGFFMADDFHGTEEWQDVPGQHEAGIPGSPYPEIEDKDAIFHTVYDLVDRYQIAGPEHFGYGL